MIDKASFYLDKYTFNKVNIDLDSTSLSDIEINFSPSGIFKENTPESIYDLKLIFKAKDKGCTYVEIECNSVFKFTQAIRFEEIPKFFYANCIAIIFPYIRAFISTVTLQANITPIVLPTMNLSSLAEPLKNNTKETKI